MTRLWQRHLKDMTSHDGPFVKKLLMDTWSSRTALKVPMPVGTTYVCQAGVSAMSIKDMD